MKTLLLLGVVTLVVVGVGFLTGCGEPHRGHFPHKSPYKIAKFITNKIVKELNLNEEQKTKFNIIKEEIVAKHKSKKPDHEAMHAEIKALVLSDDIDQAELNRLIDQKMEKHHQHLG